MHLDERSGCVKGQNAEINTDCQMSGRMKPNSWKGNHLKLEINPNTVLSLILLGNCFYGDVPNVSHWNLSNKVSGSARLGLFPWIV